LHPIISQANAIKSPAVEAGYDGSKAPLVVLSSHPPRKCGIATFTEEALEFIGAHLTDRPIHIISHLDGRGPNVHPILDQNDPRDGHSDELDRRMKGEGADHVRICRIG